jgi:hypothetical protein
LEQEVSIRRRVPLLKIKHYYTPSIDLADVQLGGIFHHTDGRRVRSFMLIDRDPWKATIIRYTRWDEFLFRLGVWVRDRFSKKG